MATTLTWYCCFMLYAPHCTHQSPLHRHLQQPSRCQSPAGRPPNPAHCLHPMTKKAGSLAQRLPALHHHRGCNSDAHCYMRMYTSVLERGTLHQVALEPLGPCEVISCRSSTCVHSVADKDLTFAAIVTTARRAVVPLDAAFLLASKALVRTLQLPA